MRRGCQGPHQVHARGWAMASRSQACCWRASTGQYVPLRGGWLSDVPPDPNEGAWGDVLLRLSVALNERLTWDFKEEGKPYRDRAYILDSSPKSVKGMKGVNLQ